MHAQIHTIAFPGIETIDVTVQIHIANGLPAMAIVGLADKAVAESREPSCNLSSAVSADCGDEPMRMRLSW